MTLGSPWIAIAPKDILRLNISIKPLRKATDFPIVSLGGHKFWRFLLRNVGIRMRDEKGKVIGVNMPSISVLWPTKKKWPDEVKDIPSVLGSDFLTSTKFYLHFDPSKQKAFIGKNS